MDESNNPDNPYDKGAPDYQTGVKKNLKHKIICLGVDNLIKQEKLDEENVMIWVDWQSVRRRRGTRTPSTLRPDSPWPPPDRARATPPTRRRFRRTTRRRSSPACSA